MIRPSALGAGSPALELLVFNIFVKDLGERTKVRVNASFLAIRDDAAINCYSNGTLETWIFDSVQELLEEDG